MKDSIKHRLRTIRGFGHTLHRGPVLVFLSLRHVIAPAGVRYVQGVRRSGFQEAHWEALGKGLVRFFQESGPVLTKLGQILATRTDMISPALIRQLEALFDRQPAMTRNELELILRSAFGNELPFALFDKEPIAVGSVGQVHRARLEDGTRVIVKVVRPGSKRRIKQDVLTLTYLTAAAFFWLGRSYRSQYRMLRRVLEDLEVGFLRELDFGVEAETLERFRKRMRRNSKVYIPKVYRDLSSTNVLVVEEIEGESLARFRKRAKDDGHAAKALAELAFREILTQIFEDGNFHADPHAGNFIVMKDGRLGLIDFGLVGNFTKSDRKKISKAVKALIARDVDAVISSLLEFGTLPSDFDRQSFKNEIVAQFKEKQCAGASLDELVNQLFAIAHRHQIYVPQSTTLLIKTLVTIEGVARSLDPELSVVSVAAPVILRSLTPKWIRMASSIFGG